MLFQTIDWFGVDEDSGYKIYASARKPDGSPVQIKVSGFRPYFHILITSTTRAPINKSVIDTIRTMISDQIANSRGGIKPKIADISLSETPYKNIYGFSLDSLPQLVIRCECPNHSALKFILYKCINPISQKGLFKIDVCDCNLEPFLEFLNSKNITPCSWIEIPDNSFASNGIFSINTGDLRVVERHDMSPIVICSFDIECTSGDGSFPDPSRPSDSIIMIASVFQRFGESEPYMKHVVVLGDIHISDGDSTNYDIVDTEIELIKSWVNIVSSNKPDIITGYNTVSFDMKYIWQRMLHLNPKDKKCTAIKCALKRFDTIDSVYENKSLQSSALGNNDFNYINIFGVNHVDMLYYIRKEYKLESYKLDDVAFEFVGQNKNPVSPKMIFDLFKGSPMDKKVVVDYCVKDAMLPLQLMLKLSVIPNLVQMANVTRVPLRYLMFRGQQIKVYSQISYSARQNNYVIPKLKDGQEFEGKYEGAIVLNAKSGAYKCPITALDFASLYPTIIIAHNLCYTTYVNQPLWTFLVSSKLLDLLDKNTVIPDTNIVFNTWSIRNTQYIIKEFVIYDNVYRFVQSPKVGLLPSILKELLKARKSAKKDMNNATDPFMKSIYNGKQLALKISCNSVYGFCGASNGMLPLVDIASCVCAIGRTMIEKTKYLVEFHYDAEVVYGDTDSNLVRFYPPDSFNGDEKAYSFDIGTKAGEFITAELNKDAEYKGSIELEFEKVYLPYMLFTKKRYCGLMYESLDKPPKIDIKGLQVVRRDNAPIVKEICNMIIEKLIKENFNVDDAVKNTKQVINQLISNEIDIDKLIVSKKLSAIPLCDYKDCCKNYAFSKFQYTNICDVCISSLSDTNKELVTDNQKLPHVEVARKMLSRPDADNPSPGDRVQYVFVKYPSNKKKVLQYKLAEDPNYVKQHNLKLDYEYYLKHQIKNPVCDLFKLIRDPQKLIFDQIERDISNKQKGQLAITSFF